MRHIIHRLEFGEDSLAGTHLKGSFDPLRDIDKTQVPGTGGGRVRLLVCFMLPCPSSRPHPRLLHEDRSHLLPALPRLQEEWLPVHICLQGMQANREGLITGPTPRLPRPCRASPRGATTEPYQVRHPPSLTPQQLLLHGCALMTWVLQPAGAAAPPTPVCVCVSAPAAIWFRYDMNPITVSYTDRKTPLYHFITTVSTAGPQGGGGRGGRILFTLMCAGLRVRWLWVMFSSCLL